MAMSIANPLFAVNTVARTPKTNLTSLILHNKPYLTSSQSSAGLCSSNSASASKILLKNIGNYHELAIRRRYCTSSKPQAMGMKPAGRLRRSRNIVDQLEYELFNIVGLEELKTELRLWATNNNGATSHVIQTVIDYEKKIEEFEFELSKIVGLEELKLQLRKWSKGLLLDEKRRAMGIELGPKKSPHMAFLGNPGTGKTTVARVLGKLLHSVGVLSSDKVTEVQRSDLVGGYQGHTALKTRTKIIEATGGVLFVDEAYRLVPEYTVGKTDVGLEALEEIMSVLEDGDLVVIFAGYTEPMKRVFSSNAGFCRRVTHFYEFNDFSCDELTEMVMIKMNKQDKKSPLFGFKLHPLCTFEAIREVIENNSTEKLRSKMNGGLVDHMLNNAKENLDSRLSINTTATVDEIMTITVDDLLSGLQLLSKSIKF